METPRPRSASTSAPLIETEAELQVPLVRNVQLKSPLAWEPTDTNYEYEDNYDTSSIGMKLQGIRLSNIPDGSFFHAILKAARTLQGLGPNSPLLQDFSAAYLDTDYDSLNIEERKNLVARLRVDIVGWLNKEAVSTETGVPFTELEAILILNDDIRNIRKWFSGVALNPNSYKLQTSKAEASKFLDILLGGDFIVDQKGHGKLMVPSDMVKVYVSYCQTGRNALESRLLSPEIQHLRDYMTTNVVNNRAQDRMEAGVKVHEAERKGEIVEAPSPRNQEAKTKLGAALNAATFFDSDADSVINLLLDGKDGLILQVLEVCRRMPTSFREHVETVYPSQVSTNELIAMTQNPETRSKIAATLQKQLAAEVKAGTPDWYMDRVASTGVGKRDKIIQQEVDSMLEATNIRDITAHTLPHHDWKELTSLVNSHSPYQLLVALDQLLVDQPEETVMSMLKQRATGNYLQVLLNYVKARSRLIRLVQSWCAFDALDNDSKPKYKYASYTPADVEKLTIADDAWKLLGNSIDKKTGKKFTPEDLQELKRRDPRELMGLEAKGSINTNYYLLERGYVLRDGLDYDNVIKNVLQGEIDDELLLFFVYLFGINLHTMQITPTSAKIDRNYLSEVFNSPHVFLNRPSNIRYEVFGIVDDTSTPHKILTTYDGSNETINQSFGVTLS